METLRKDLKFAVKLFRKEKGFTATTILTLAICIGVNCAVFSAINALLLRPLPFEEPDRQVYMYNSYPNAGVEESWNSPADFFFRRAEIDAFEEVGGYIYDGLTITEKGSPERVQCMGISASLFPMLGIQPFLGRTFTEEENVRGNHYKIILGYGVWQGRFGGDESVLGRELNINGISREIVGVMPRDFRFLDDWPHTLYVPLAFRDEHRTLEALHTQEGLRMIARLKPEATIEQAQEQIDALNARQNEEWPAPNGRQLMEEAGFHTVVLKLETQMEKEIRFIFLILWAGVIVVLLIGCVNIANMMLARLTVRMHELATRIALGADHWQLCRQMLTESLLLSFIGGILGLGVAALGLQLMKVLRVDQFPRGSDIALDGSTLLFTLLIVTATGLFFGIIPLISLFRSRLSAIYQLGGLTRTAGRRTVFFRNSLVISQVSLAFMLLIGAGLLLASLRNVLKVDPGFDSDSVLTGFIALTDVRYNNPENIEDPYYEGLRRNFTDELLEKIRVLPGVKSAAITTQMPFLSNMYTNVIMPEGYELGPDESIKSPRRGIISPGYFKTMGIPLQEGRDFKETDNHESKPVVIIDEWLARHFWPDNSPIGKRMYRGVPEDEMKEEDYLTVIGVVGEVKNYDLEQMEVGNFYISYRQEPPNFIVVVIRAEKEPTSLIKPLGGIVADIDPELPFFLPWELKERISLSLRERSTPTTLLILSAGMALFLAAIGLYGMLAYSVSQRTREIGIRIALGSTMEQIRQLIVMDGIKLLAMGLVFGIAGTIVFSKLIRAQLYGIGPADPLVFTIVIVAMAVVTVLACLVPAHRATQVDPVQALNYE